MLTYRSEIMANFQFLLILIVYVKTVQSIVPSAYYADNGVQTEKVHEMKSRDKRELRHEILTLLGLHKKPNPKDHSTKAYSAPKFMLSLYNSITTDDGAVNDDEKAFHTKHDVTIGDATIQPIEGTDVIVSYFNRARKIRHLRHEKDRTFFFDFSKESSNDTVVKGAELRLYKEKARRWKKHPFQIQIYMIKQGKDPEDKTLESLSNVTVAANHQGWITFNLTRAAVQWISSYKSNYGLFMKVLFIHKGREVDPGKFGIINNRGPKDKQPFMVGFYLSHTTLDMAKTRTAFRRKREAYRDEKEKYLDHSRQKRAAPGRWPCQRRSLYVKFRDLGWQSWIIAPDGYSAFFCEGECTFPIGAHVNATNHAIVQTLVHMTAAHKAPSPGCAPTKLGAQSVLYFDDDSNVVLKKFPKMIVKSCGCH